MAIKARKEEKLSRDNEINIPSGKHLKLMNLLQRLCFAAKHVPERYHSTSTSIQHPAAGARAEAAAS